MKPTAKALPPRPSVVTNHALMRFRERFGPVKKASRVLEQRLNEARVPTKAELGLIGRRRWRGGEGTAVWIHAATGMVLVTQYLRRKFVIVTCFRAAKKVAVENRESAAGCF